MDEEDARRVMENWRWRWIWSRSTALTVASCRRRAKPEISAFWRGVRQPPIIKPKPTYNPYNH